MPSPGDPAGDCPRCDSGRVQIGVGIHTLGAYCNTCESIQPMPYLDVLTREAIEESDWSNFEVREYADYGPDPWG